MLDIFVAASAGVIIGAVGVGIYARKAVSKFTTVTAVESPDLILKDKTVYRLRAEADMYVGQGKVIRAGTVVDSTDPVVLGREHMFSKVKR